MKADLLQKMFSVSLKTRILREWQKSNRAQDQQFSERELLTLELINDFSPITEKGLSKIFGVTFTAVGDLVKKLAELKLIDISEKARGKPLVLTKSGKECLEKLKELTSVRYDYLFESVDENEEKVLMKLFEKIDKNAERAVQHFVFDRYTEE